MGERSSENYGRKPENNGKRAGYLSIPAISD
jgi:hypothetical protein